MLKVNLHFHTAEDPSHCLPYTLKQAIEYARKQGFDVLALTCHRAFVYTPEDRAYATQMGVLLISGIEAQLRDERNRRFHVLILNGDKASESVRSFDDLRAYKQSHPEVFVIAPHPFFYGNFSLHDNLEKHIELFDAIEHSWFYTRYFNRNERAREVAERHQKPFIATSDAHILEMLETDYLLVGVTERTPQAIFSGIRAGNYRNVSSPRTFAGTFLRFGWFTVKDRAKMLARKLLRRNRKKQE